MIFFKRWFFWTFVFAVAGGVFLHLKMDIPLLSSWIGNLPGDLILKKGEIKVYFPLSSALLTAVVFSFVLNLFKK